MSGFSYKRKLVVSGNIIESYEYEKPIFKGFKDDRHTGRKTSAKDEDKLENREKVLSRAKRDIRRIINSNIHMYGPPSKFITLTFKDEIRDIESANYEWKKARQRLETHLGFKLKYLAVPELQHERQVWHYHVVMFNLPYIKNQVLGQIWGKGFVRINRIDRVDNVGAYVSKYMSKETSEKLEGKKCYFTSRQLYQPIEVTNEKEIEAIGVALPQNNLVYQSEFENDYTGNVIYKQYNMNVLANKLKDAK